MYVAPCVRWMCHCLVGQISRLITCTNETSQSEYKPQDFGSRHVIERCLWSLPSRRRALFSSRRSPHLVDKLTNHNLNFGLTNNSSVSVNWHSTDEVFVICSQQLYYVIYQPQIKPQENTLNFGCLMQVKNQLYNFSCHLILLFLGI